MTKPLPREDAVELLRAAMEQYVLEQYDGEADKQGLLMELKYNISPNGIGAMITWFTHTLEGLTDDLLIAILIAWTEPADQDFGWVSLEA